MKIDIVTLFPEMFAGVFDTSILKRAQEDKKIEINLHNLRDWADDKHKTVDDTPCGGGAGMVMKVDVMDRCLSGIKSKVKSQKSKVILLTPQGTTFDQKKARYLSKTDHMILICGHYEGFDQRIREHLIDEEVSIGDYVLTGGEIPAMVITDAVSRLVPGVIKEESHMNESFSVKPQENTNNSEKYTEYPHYTRPIEYKGWKVPDILLSGNHGEIEKWRNEHIKKKP